jgi:hypothetical protein
MQSPEDAAQVVMNELAIFELARARYADAVRLEAEMEANKPAVKQAAILRMMQTPDPRYATEEGKPVKLLPATEAEKYVERDETYASYLLNQRNLAHSRMRAETDFQSAQLRASLHLTLCKSLLGVA